MSTLAEPMAVPRDNPGVVDPRTGYPEEFRDRVRQAFKEEGDKKTRRQLAAEFGIEPGTLREWVGPDPRWNKGYRQREMMMDRVREMHWDGNTYHHIARVTGVPVSTVWDYINRPDKYR
jgi:hypothetical protein